MTLVFRSRNRSNALHPVNRIKHVIDSQLGVVLGVPSVVVLAASQDNPTQAIPVQVAIGSKINGIYLRVECYATTAGALANAYMMVIKNPGGNLAFPNPNAVGPDDNKRYVIHQEMVMLQKQVDGNPRTLFNSVIVIPRGYRRQGPGDSMSVVIFAPGVNLDACVQCHYKEFR